MRSFTSSARLFGLLLMVAVVACSPAAPPPPEPPASLEKPAEYAWGDMVASADNRLARHVDGALRRTYGQPRETHYVARDAATLRALQPWYRERLDERWKPLPLPFLAPEAGFGFTDGKQAFVVAWLRPQSNGRVPVTVFRFEDAV